MTKLRKIQGLSSRILKAGKFEYGEIFQACNMLFNALVEVSDLDMRKQEKERHLFLKKGNAIRLSCAARCLQDILRTKRFIDAVFMAVTEILEKDDTRPVHILYAGTGPFATLVLPLTARFTSSQVQFTLLEINESSYENVGNLFTELELNDYVYQLIHADATQWEIPKDQLPVSILLTETMQQGLRDEPQIALCLNLLGQLPPEVVLIPEQINLRVGWMNLALRTREKMGEIAEDNSISELAEVFSATKETLLGQAQRYARNEARTYYFPEKVIQLPDTEKREGDSLYLFTDLVVYKNEMLRLDESILTLPMKLMARDEQKESALYFRYRVNEKPELEYYV